MLMQTLAIFRDAYRELNHKKMFWIVLAISGLVVAAFAAVGINEKGLSVLWWQINSGVFNTSLMSRDMFYKSMFAGLGVGVWLTWGATILAIISVSSLIPDFVAGGSIDLVLSRPIGRVRLFLTKYLAGLLFVGLQVTVFTVAAFLVIGIRGRVWEPGLLWCIPLVLLFFSYLYAVCTLVGLVTRSTIAALLITMLVWLMVFGLQTTESLFLSFRIRDEMRLAQLDKDIAGAGENADRVQRLENKKSDITKSSKMIRNTHRGLFAAMTVLPKTKATVGVLERILVSQADLDQLNRNNDSMPPIQFDPDDVRISTREFTKRIKQEERERPLWWIIGTSVGFEFVVLGLACGIFARRDF